MDRNPRLDVPKSSLRLRVIIVNRADPHGEIPHYAGVQVFASQCMGWRSSNTINILCMDRYVITPLKNGALSFQFPFLSNFFHAFLVFPGSWCSITLCILSPRVCLSYQISNQGLEFISTFKLNRLLYPIDIQYIV